MVITCGFHNDTGLTRQASKQLCQFAQFAVRLMDFKGGTTGFSKGMHDGNHALAFGNINANWLDDIVQLPNGSYNTGIATYIWIITKGKPEEHTGKVQFIDVSR